MKLYGRKFLRLIKNSKRGYDAMMESEIRPQDPNHQNVIELGSSDEGEDADVDYDLDDLENDPSQGERSEYFQHDDEVEAFNARCE